MQDLLKSLYRVYCERKGQYDLPAADGDGTHDKYRSRYSRSRFGVAHSISRYFKYSMNRFTASETVFPSRTAKAMVREAGTSTSFATMR